MPMIDIVTTASVCKQTEGRLIEGLGKAIALIPGKSEKSMMMRISGDNTMAFRGVKTNAAYIRVDVAGHAEKEVYQPFGETTVSLLAEILEIPIENIYLTIQELPVWVVHRPS